MSALPHHVPGFSGDEHEDPRNRLIDAFEATVQSLIDNGLEAQLRTRLARLLPPPEPLADLFSAPAQPMPAAAGPEAELELAALITDCGRLEKFKMSAVSHASVARIKARAATDLAIAKSLRANP